MIASWSQVEHIERVRLLVDGSQRASRIYGNLRNCATVEVLFEAYAADQQSNKLYAPAPKPGFQVQLVDYESRLPLAWEMFPCDWKGGQGVFYSTCRGRFENQSSPVEESSETMSQWSSVKFYVYGLAEEELTRSIGVVFKSTDGKTLDSNNHDNRIDLQVLPPVLYTTEHLKPIKWSRVKLEPQVETKFKQWNAFLELRNEQFFWAACDINNHPDPMTDDDGPLYRINRGSSLKCPTYMYFLCPLGHHESSYIRRDSALKLVYNQKPGSLCLIRLKSLINQSGRRNQERAKKQLLYQTSVTISLFDLYGNLGSFRISLNDGCM